MTLHVGAVVLSFEDAELVLGAIASLTAGSRVPDELVVVDNASSAEVIARQQRAAPGVELLLRPSNDGYGAAMNEAAAVLSERGCDVLVFLTHDCRLERDALAALEAHLEHEPATSVVGPVLGRSSVPSRVWSAGGDLKGRRLAPRHRLHGQALATVGEDDRTPCAWLDGAALVVRSAAFEAVGGFRTEYFLYWEDVDLCRELAAAGGDVVCLTAARGWQEPSMTPAYLACRNRLLYLRRKGDRAGVVAATGEALLRVLRDLGRGQGRLAVLGAAGVWDGLRGHFRPGLARERP
jgi:N-acetylglucosaminyl-diphospho-decaprenol L-rhamnosyltransferase